MNREQIIQALQNIDESIIYGAFEYEEKARKKRKLKKAIVLVACACLVLTAIFLPLIYRHNHYNPYYTDNNVSQISDDAQTIAAVDLDEVFEYEPFGMYFASWLPSGYELEGEIQVYAETIMAAAFYNEDTGDFLIIDIYPKTDVWTSKVETTLTMNEVYHNENGSSYIYVDCGDYVVYYSSQQDLSKIDGFEDMIYSSEYFLCMN